MAASRNNDETKIYFSMSSIGQVKNNMAASHNDDITKKLT
jgi:hypothetical protein